MRQAWRILLVASVVLAGCFQGPLPPPVCLDEESVGLRPSGAIRFEDGPRRNHLVDGMVTGDGSAECPYRIAGREFTRDSVTGDGFAVRALFNADDHVVVEDNVFRDLDGGAVLVTGAESVVVRGNVFEAFSEGKSSCSIHRHPELLEKLDYEKKTIDPPIMMAAVSVDNVDDVRIEGNEFSSSLGATIHVQRIENVEITGNRGQDLEEVLCGTRLGNLTFSDNVFHGLRPPGGRTGFEFYVLDAWDPLGETISWAPYLHNVVLQNNSFEDAELRILSYAGGKVLLKHNVFKMTNVTRFADMNLGARGGLHSEGNLFSGMQIAPSVGTSLSFRDDRFENFQGGGRGASCLSISRVGERENLAVASMINTTFDGCLTAVASADEREGWYLELYNSTFMNNEFAVGMPVRGVGNVFVNNSKVASIGGVLNGGVIFGNERILGGVTSSGRFTTERMNTTSACMEWVCDRGHAGAFMEDNWWGCKEGPLDGQSCDQIERRQRFTERGEITEYWADVAPWLVEPPEWWKPTTDLGT